MGNINSTHVTVDSAATNPVVTAETTGIIPVPYDYIGVVAGSTTDVYSYKSGGASGVLVATVTVTWTDATKTQISSVLRTSP
jgi:hypothetical protein